MHYWYRPPVHLCEAPDDERTLCGTRITGLSPTVRPLPRDADPAAHFEDNDAEICENCLRVLES